MSECSDRLHVTLCNAADQWLSTGRIDLVQVGLAWIVDEAAKRSDAVKWGATIKDLAGCTHDLLSSG